MFPEPFAAILTARTWLPVFFVPEPSALQIMKGTPQQEQRILFTTGVTSKATRAMIRCY